MNLNSVLIGSEEPKRLAEYYTKLFGDPGWDMGGYVGWQVGSGGLTVGPHDQVHGKNTEPGRVIWNIETPDMKGRVRRTGLERRWREAAPAASPRSVRSSRGPRTAGPRRCSALRRRARAERSRRPRRRT